MNFKFSKIVFSPLINFHFSSSSYVYVSGPLGTISIILPYTFNLKSSLNKRFFKISLVRHFLSNLRFLVFSVMSGYHVFIDLVGLGYRLKKITKVVYRFYVGQSHYVYVHLPSDVLLFAYLNKIILFSIYADKLFSLFTSIMLLRKLNSYKLRGLMRPGQIIVLKEGKQR